MAETKAAINALGFLLFLTACGEPPRPPEASFEGEALGTTYRVRLSQNLSESERVAVRQAIDAVFEDVRSRMSPDSPDSELARINGAPAGEELPVSGPVFHVFREALRVSELTGGAFDVTASPLVRVFQSNPPAAADIASAKARVGFHNLILDDDSVTIQKSLELLECDLSAIARGYAVDRVAESLEADDYRNYFVDLGGEVRTRGKDPEGEAWPIPIDKPTSGERQIQRTLRLSGLALATSKNERSFGDPAAKLQLRLIDPRTARPLDGRLSSVTVLEDSCLRAKALAEGILALGPEEGYEIAVREDLSVLFLLRSEDGTVVEKTSPAFAALFF